MPSLVNARVRTTKSPATGVLPPAERDWLVGRMGREERHREQRHGFTLLQAMTDPAVVLLCLIYSTVAMGANGWLWFCWVVLALVTVGVFAARPV